MTATRHSKPDATGRQVYRGECSCGWRAFDWRAERDKAEADAVAHAREVATTEASPATLHSDG